jgi:hypothetical protein
MKLSRAARRDLTVAGIATALGMLLYPGAAFRGESFFERDLHLDWYPRLEAIARCLLEGALPLWDPSIGFGQPLLADPGAQVLYPLTWLALLVPLQYAYTVFVFAHLVIAAAGTARLARRLGAGALGAPLAAVVFVLGGPYQSSVNLWHHFAGLSWMPWVLLGVDAVARKPRPQRVLGLGAAAALQIVAGSADVCLMTLALSILLAVVRLASTAALRRRARAVTGFVASALLALAVTAAMWWPALDVVSRAPRRALPSDIREAWSLPVSGLPRLALPLDPDRVPFDPRTWRRLYDRPSPPFLWSVDLGLCALALGLLALGARRLRPRASVLHLAALAAIVLALGPHGPLYPVAVEALPFLKAFRYPTKALLGTGLVTALLAGLGAGALSRGRVSRRSRLAVGAVLLVATGSGLAYGWSLGARGLAPALTLALLAAGAILLGIGRRMRALPMAGLVAALAVVDLLVAHVGLNATASPALIFAPPRAVTAVDRTNGHRLYVYDYHSVAGEAARHLGRSDPYPLAVAAPPGLSRQERVAAMRLYLPPPSAGLYGIEGSYDIDLRGLYPRPLNDLVFFLRRVEGTPVHTKLLRMGAVGTVLSLHRAGLEGLRFDGELGSLFPEPILVWRVPSPLPRAIVVGGVRVADEAAAFQTLVDPSFDPARSVLLPTGTPRPADPSFAGRARLVARRSDRVRLEVDASSAAYLVLADAYDPGWKATVDGHEAAVLRANVAFRAVAVPAGTHVVEMRYRPRPVEIGALVSVGSLAALALAAVVLLVRRRGAPGD